MREMKFRAWDGGRMVYSHNNTINKDNFQLHWFFEKIREDAVVMQFTGMKDANGKDVYDGDLLEFDKKEWGGDNNIHEVSWDRETAGWSFGGGTAQSDMQFRTVVGNIYENQVTAPQ